MLISRKRQLTIASDILVDHIRISLDCPKEEAETITTGLVYGLRNAFNAHKLRQLQERLKTFLRPVEQEEL